MMEQIKMEMYRQHQLPFGTLKLEHLKNAFTSIVGSADTTALPQFFMWVDMKVAEYKCAAGYVFPGSASLPPVSNQYDSSAYYSKDSSSYSDERRSSSYGMSPDTTVQTEALELTMSPSKPKASKSEQNEYYGDYDRRYTPTKNSSSHSPVYVNEAQPEYKSHHSPVYGCEASGIINLSLKPSHSESATTTSGSIAAHTTPALSSMPSLHTSTATYSVSSPAKPEAQSSPTSPPLSLKSEPTSKPDAYSSLRSLLEARKTSDLPASTNTGNQSVTASPAKSMKSEKSAGSPSSADHKTSECAVCGKTFQYRSSYRRHMKLHQGVYTHECAACHRKFTRKEHFVRHKCNRKPNIPNRGVGRVELTPDMLPASKMPQPKVAYPPTLDEQQISNLVAAQAYSSPVKQGGSYSPYSSSIGYPSPIQHQQQQSAMCTESRRRKAQPRKWPGNGGVMDDTDEVVKAYESPVHTPATHYTASAPSSPQDLSMSHEALSPQDLSAQEQAEMQQQYQQPQQQEVKPIEIVPETINTITGTYQIQEEDAEKCIKVTKQSNYLKLRNEAQLVNGELQFVCPHCTKVFHKSSNFSRHMRTHRGLFSYECRACNRGFFRREHFQKHKCGRHSMSHIGQRKTKLELAASSDGEKSDHLSDNVSEISDEEEIEAGIDLGDERMEEEEREAGGYESAEEGDLVVDEGPEGQEEEEDMESMNSPMPPPVLSNA